VPYGLRRSHGFKFKAEVDFVKLTQSKHALSLLDKLDKSRRHVLGAFSVLGGALPLSS
jgi:hypothetical protein